MFRAPRFQRSGAPRPKPASISATPADPTRGLVDAAALYAEPVRIAVRESQVDLDEVHGDSLG